MEEQSGEGSVATPVEQLRDFLSTQLAELEDPRNVHRVRERLYGDRWSEQLDLESLPEGVAQAVTAQVGKAWGALSRYPWDLHGAQQALKSAVELAVDKGAAP